MKFISRGKSFADFSLIIRNAHFRRGDPKDCQISELPHKRSAGLFSRMVDLVASVPQ